MVKNNTYVYLDHLSAFDICRPVEDMSRLVILPEIHSPLLASVWETELLGHPDRAYVKYILQGLNRGFRFGFDRRLGMSLFCFFSHLFFFPAILLFSTYSSEYFA